VATNRRDALKSALLSAAVGMGAISESGLAVGRDSTAEPKPEGQVTLYGVRWQITSEDLSRGELPTAGVRMLVRGEIFDKPSGGCKTGDFFATYYRLNTPGKVALDVPGSLELHTFVFSDGTLVGSGVANSAPDSEGQFAVIGGTGRYHGAKGSYFARQSYAELGGSGTAMFTLKLI
jgi:hypothetical protein